MFLNEIQAIFVFFMFFRANVSQVKLDNISFLFKFNRRHTNYQTIKFLQLYLQKTFTKNMKQWRQPLKGFLQNRFYDTLTFK